MKIRNNLVKTRNEKQLTQKELAIILNITERHYQYIEAGTSDGSVKLWQQLAKYFNTTIDFLLEQEVQK